MLERRKPRPKPLAQRFKPQELVGLSPLCWAVSWALRLLRRCRLCLAEEQVLRSSCIMVVLQVLVAFLLLSVLPLALCQSLRLQRRRKVGLEVVVRKPFRQLRRCWLCPLPCRCTLSRQVLDYHSPLVRLTTLRLLLACRAAVILALAHILEYLVLLVRLVSVCLVVVLSLLRKARLSKHCLKIRWNHCMGGDWTSAWSHSCRTFTFSCVQRS